MSYRTLALLALLQLALACVPTGSGNQRQSTTSPADSTKHTVSAAKKGDSTATDPTP